MPEPVIRPALGLLVTLLAYGLPFGAGLIVIRRLRWRNGCSPVVLGLVAGLMSFLLVRDAAFSLSLGTDWGSWWKSAPLQAAFLAGVLLPSYWAQWRPGMSPGRRTLWVWTAAVGLHAAAEGWAVAAALAGGDSLRGMAPLMLRQLAVGGGIGLLGAAVHRPSRWEVALILLMGAGPAALTGWAYPTAGLSQWVFLFRAGAAGLLLAGLVGGHWLDTALTGNRADAEAGFGLALAGGVLLMGVLYQLETWL